MSWKYPEDEEYMNKLDEYLRSEENVHRDHYSDCNSIAEYLWEVGGVDQFTFNGLTLKLIDEVIGQGDGAPQQLVFSIVNTVSDEETMYYYHGYQSSWDRDSWDDTPIQAISEQKTITVYKNTE